MKDASSEVKPLQFPFAVNYPEIAAKEWSLWRDCGWEPGRKADGK